MGENEFAEHGPEGGDIFSPVDNSLAGANLAKTNLQTYSQNLSRINGGLNF